MYVAVIYNLEVLQQKAPKWLVYSPNEVQSLNGLGDAQFFGLHCHAVFSITERYFAGLPD